MKTNLSDILHPEEWDDIVTPISGGKDSQALLSLALATPGVREKLKIVHNFTGYDHSLTLAHIAYMEEHYGVRSTDTRSEKYADVFDLVKKERYFPSSLARNCTSLLKIKPFAKWLHDGGYAGRRTLVLLGMRAAESVNRRDQYGAISPADLFSICDISKDYQKRLKAIRVQLGIVDWSTPDVFEYLRRTGAKINPLYAKGHKRVGCYPCLLAGDAEWRLAARDPEGQEHMRRLIAQEDEFKADPTQKRKLTRIHPTRDVRGMLATGIKGVDPFGFDEDDGSSGCAQCDL